MTDRRGGISATYDSDAFGVLLEQTGGVANPFVFTAREFEAELGLYYYRARYYDPALGRFLSEDPYPPSVYVPADMNRYVYARNAPTRYTDPFGLQGEPSLARTAAETALSHTGATYDVYRFSTVVYDAASSVKTLRRSVARAADSPTAQVAVGRLQCGATARATGHALAIATSTVALGPTGAGTYIAVAGSDMANVARTAVTEMLRPTPGQPAAGSPSAAPLPGAASATAGLSPGDAALLSAQAPLAPVPPQTGGFGMGVAPLRQAVGGPPGGLSREAPAGGRDTVIVMAREAQARTEQVEAVLRHQLAEEAARNAQRRFSAVQAEQAEQADACDPRRARSPRGLLDVTGDLVQRAAAIRGEADALKTAQDGAIQAIKWAATRSRLPTLDTGQTGPALGTLSCLANRARR